MRSVNDPTDLLERADLRDALLAVAGVSNKARKKLSVTQLDSLIQAVIASIAQQAKATHLNFREELVDRYLLTQGDALGGKMRNWMGAAAQRKLTNAIKHALGSQPIEDHAKPSGKIDRIAWDNRLLLFDIKPKFIGKNVDVILLSPHFARTLDTLGNMRGEESALGR